MPLKLKLDKKTIIFIILLFGVLLFTFAWLEISASKKEFDSLVEEKSHALMASLLKGSQNAVSSFEVVQDLLAEKLLSQTRLLEELDHKSTLNESDIFKISQDNNIFRINIFNEDGSRFLSNAPGYGRNNNRQSALNTIKKMQDFDRDELIVGFRQSKFGTGNRFAVAKKRRKGGVIILNVDAKEMLEFRKYLGIGRFIKNLGENEGVAFVALQNDRGIQAASSGVDSLTAFEADSFLTKAAYDSVHHSRYTLFKSVPVYEIVQPLFVDGEYYGLLRLGLDLDHFTEIQNTGYRRIISVSVALFLLGVVFAGWGLGRQNYQTLESEYKKVDTFNSLILDNMIEAFIATDTEGRVTLFNKSASHIFDQTESQIFGQPLKNVSKQLAQLFVDFKSSDTNFNNTIQHFTIDHRTKIFSINFHKLSDQHLNAPIFFAVLEDITKQRQLEENSKRQEKLTAIGHLASGMAHEIRNPLNAISIIAQRFHHEFEPTSDKDEYLKLSKSVVEESKRINQIIQEFLTFAKPQPLDKKKVSMNELLTSIHTLYEPKTMSKEIKLQTNCEENINIVLDENRFRQVVVNLLENAIDSTKPTGVIKINCKKMDEQIVLSITDSGAGIPPKDLDKIFNMYFTTKAEGSGLGLAMVQQIVSQHNGTINVKSEENNGTEFTIHIPKGEDNE